MITYLMLTAGIIAGSLWTNRNKFVELMEVKRYRAFIDLYPDHPVAQWHDEKRSEEIYAEKKADAKEAVVLAGTFLVWPLSFLLFAALAVYDRLDEKNDKMTNKIVIDHARIREEEGR